MSDGLISIISICATVILGIAGFIVNSFIQRKNNSIEIITKSRIARRDRLQELSTVIIELTDVDYLENVAKENWPVYVEKITQACSELRTLLEFEYKHDVFFVDAAYRLKGTVMCFREAFNPDEYKSARNAFLKVMDVYTSSEWKRIKLETVGKQWKGKKGIDWNGIYDDNSAKYDETVAEYHK